MLGLKDLGLGMVLWVCFWYKKSNRLLGCDVTDLHSDESRTQVHTFVEELKKWWNKFWLLSYSACVGPPDYVIRQYSCSTSHSQEGFYLQQIKTHTLWISCCNLSETVTLNRLSFFLTSALFIMFTLSFNPNLTIYQFIKFLLRLQ